MPSVRQQPHTSTLCVPQPSPHSPSDYTRTGKPGLEIWLGRPYVYGCGDRWRFWVSILGGLGDRRKGGGIGRGRCGGRVRGFWRRGLCRVAWLRCILDFFYQQSKNIPIITSASRQHQPIHKPNNQIIQQIQKQMPENNRNRKQLTLQLANKQIPASISIQPSQYSQSLSRSQLPEPQTLGYPIQLPITHLQFTNNKNNSYDKNNSNSISNNNDEEYHEDTISSKSIVDGSGKQQNLQTEIIDILYSDYENIMKGMNERDVGRFEKIVSELNRVYGKCMEIKINMGKIVGQMKQKSILKTRNKIMSQNSGSGDNEEWEGFQWMILLINVSLNLWKLLNQSNHKLNKYMPAIQILKKTSNHLLTVIHISPQQQQPSFFNLLPDKIKNKLILLLIIWAKQQLAQGNTDQALRICNICSYQIMGNNNGNNGSGINWLTKCRISKENKLKLHYLRMRIFHDLGKEKQELEEILVCQSLLATMVVAKAGKGKDKGGDPFGAHVFQNGDNQVKKKGINNNNLMPKLENRKKQILNARKLVKNCLQIGYTSKFKQIRDSFQMKEKEQQKTQQNYYVKSKSIKRIRSMSSNNFQKINQQSNDNTKQLNFKNNQISMKSTCKEQFMSLHVKGNADRMNTDTVNKFISQNSRLKLTEKCPKSISAYKSRLDDSKTNRDTGKKIKEKYQLTTKKLAKRPILSSTKNKQFEDVLMDLQMQVCNQVQNQHQLKQNRQYMPSMNYYDLLAKRPQNKSAAFQNARNVEASNKQFNDYSNLPFQKKASNFQQQLQNTVNQSKGKNGGPLSQKTINECVERVQKETIDKYLQRMTILRRKRLNDERLMQNEHSQEHIGESSGDILDSNDSQEDPLQLKTKDHKQGADGKSHNKNDQQYIVQHGEPSFVLNIKNKIFPGLGMCNSINITIRKIKQFQEGAINRWKYAFIMGVSLSCEMGIFQLVHRVPQNLMLADRNIIKNINERFQVDLPSIRIKNVTLPNQSYFSEQEITSMKIMNYLKGCTTLQNKGLGLQLKQINQISSKQEQQNFFPKGEQNLFHRMCKSNRIYLQDKPSLQFLFSEANLHDVNVQAINLHRAIQKNSIEKLDQQKGKEKSPCDFQIMDKLKVLYIAIQKKSKKQKNSKLGSKSKSKQKKKQQKTVENGTNVVKKEQITVKNMVKNQKMISRKRNQKRKSFLRQNQEQDLINECGQMIESHKQSDFSMSFDDLLVPVVKYILMSQTSKPKHKLKTIIIKTKQNLDDPSIFSSQDEQNGSKNDQQNQKRLSKSSKYGMLTPFMDDQSTVKVGKVSTNIYSHIIGRYFMGVDDRKNQNRNIGQIVSIPQDVMLSIKYYLMIPNQNTFSTKLNQSLACQNYNVIDRFYDKLEYSFMVKLISEDADLSRKNYIVQVKLFRIKKLYRLGLQNFYLLKFQLCQKSARTQISQLIATSYDINKHFNTPQLNLINFLNNKERNLHEYPIQNRPITICHSQMRRKQSSIKQINNFCQKCFHSNESKQSIILGETNQQLLAEVQQKNARSGLISESQVQSQVQIHSEAHFEQRSIDQKRDESIKTKARYQMSHYNSQSIHPGLNRLSCPEAQLFQKVKHNSTGNSLFPLDPLCEMKSQTSKESFKNRRQDIIQQKIPVQYQNNLKWPVAQTTYKPIKNLCACNAQIRPFSQKDIQQQAGNSIALCLKKIAERIVVYKTLVHTRIGIQPFTSSSNDPAKQSAISCYTNKFRFSRNTNMNLAQEFFSPHLNCLQIMFQKTTRIKCDGKFAILTVLKIKQCAEFYIKIYLPESQKTMSFSLPCRVFEYFDVQVLYQIFTPYINFNYQQFKFERQKSLVRSCKQSYESYRMLKSTKQRDETDKLLELQYMVTMITDFFTSAEEQNSKKQDRKNVMKIIWNRIFKYIDFQRRFFGPKYIGQNEMDQNNFRSYLVAKFGQYEAFVKNFSAQEHIIVKNSEASSEYSVLKVQVSMGSKQGGLNFIQKNKHANAIKASKIKTRKSSNQNRFSQLKQKQESMKLYQSQTKKQLVYISIINSKTCQKICFSYYLCELLHLIDYSSLTVKNSHRQNEQLYQQNQAYKVESKEFKELILNYAVLFKVLNYIKNEYIIELQNSNVTYLPKLYKETKMKDFLKQNVDKILLCRSQNRKTVKEKQMKDLHANDQVNFQNILNNLLSCTLKLDSSDSQSIEVDPKTKQQVKITFNSQIKSQNDSKLVFLVRKVVARRGYPVCCIFLNKVDNTLKIYLSNSKKGRTKQIQMPLQTHPMPFINIIINQNNQELNHSTDSQQVQKDRQEDNSFVLAIRSRLRKYHHNLTLLTSI